MLTRLQVDGFKNLTNLDVRFGPFTCVAGPNGVGKSNLFDAIAFLSALSHQSLVEAAASVRGAEGRIGDVRTLFRRTGGERHPEIAFVADLLIPETSIDELGLEAHASSTLLRYRLRLRLREGIHDAGPIEVVEEGLDYTTEGKAKEALKFDHSSAWRQNVVTNHRGVAYLEMGDTDAGRVVQVRADSPQGKGGGNPRKLLAANLPRTVLSTATSEYRTLLGARREMMGWTQFQLEPSALRAPDPYGTPGRLSPKGGHLPATLHAMVRRAAAADPAEDVGQRVANRLAELFEDVRSLRVDLDDKREQLSLVLTELNGTEHPASSLSDGTLRFLALAVLEAGASGPSLLCLEEPENGIHPDRIPAMLDLLQDLAVDTSRPVGDDNPLRQVIVNTHSPAVLRAVPSDAIIVAGSESVTVDGRRERHLALSALPRTWRTGAGARAVPLRDVFPYIAPPAPTDRPDRLLGRSDVQLLLFGRAAK